MSRDEKYTKVTSSYGNQQYTTEDLKDINLLAAKELLHLIHEDQTLAPEWKNKMLDLLKDGVPEDITSISKMIEEDIHAST